MGSGALQARGGTRAGRGRFCGLLASSSVAALLIGGGAPQAYAACNTTYTNTTSPGCTNSAAITGIAINNSTITSTISNAGTISPDGIVLSNGSTISGAITDTGTISGGITVDHTSKINAAGSAIGITGGSFAGGIGNSGTVTAGIDGISVQSVSTFSGVISNSGTVSAGASGIVVGAVTTFADGISNSGTISAVNDGIFVGFVTTFAGGISNSGTIQSGSTGVGINVHNVTPFTGGISNSGTISAAADGIYVAFVLTFAGGVSNSGTIQSGSSGVGISINDVSTFIGGITNTGTISVGAGANGAGIFAGATSTFSGGISNSGAIFGFEGIELSHVSAFSGGVTNSGTVSGGQFGIYALDNTIFSGGVSNSGAIFAGANGIGLVGDTSFLGGISNSGQIFAGLNGIAVTGVTQFGSSSTGGGITNSGTISAANSGIYLHNIGTFVGGIANSGTITAAHGTGGIAVTNVSAFLGAITNSGAISVPHGDGIAISSVAQFGSSSVGGIANSGTISGGSRGISVGVATFIGGITNSGLISGRSGNGINVVGVSTFAGGITNTGTISGVTGILVQNSGAVSVFDSGTIVGTGGTAVDMSGNAVGSSFTLGPGYNITGKVLGQHGDALQLGGTGSGTFNLSLVLDTIAGGCSSNCPQYEGFNIFNVVSGIWTTTGTFSGTEAWNVNGGTLAGAGTFAGINVNSGGTLEPGTPGSFMTVNGNLAFASGAVYLVNLNSTTASRANVAGGVTLNGAVQGFLAPGSYSKTTTYDILDPSSISGTFTGFTAINAPGFGGTLTYQANDVLLNLAAQLGSGGGLNPNQQGVATTINNSFNDGGALPAGFFPLFGLSGAALGNALSQLSGEPATDADKGANQLMNDFLNLMLDPTAGGGGGANGGGATGFAPEQDASLPEDVALAYAKALKVPRPQSQVPSSFDQRWTAWGSAFGGTSFTDGNAEAGTNNVTASDYGFAAGMEYHETPGITYGFGLTGGGTNWNLAQALGSGRSDAFGAGIYAKTHWGPLYFSGALAFANHWFTTNRIAMGDQLQATFTGQSYAARGEVGYRYAVPITGAIVGVTPYAALQAQDFHTPSYSETDLNGGGFALSYNSQNATDTRSELGTRFDNLQVVDGMPLILRGRLAWAHDWLTNATALNAAFQTLPGSNFTVNGAAPPKNSALTTAAAELHITSNWIAIAKFDGEFGSGAQTYGGTGTLKYSW